MTEHYEVEQCGRDWAVVDTKAHRNICLVAREDHAKEIAERLNNRPLPDRQATFAVVLPQINRPPVLSQEVDIRLLRHGPLRAYTTNAVDAEQLAKILNRLPKAVALLELVDTRSKGDDVDQAIDAFLANCLTLDLDDPN